jgi:hypothetical protein
MPKKAILAAVALLGLTAVASYVVNNGGVVAGADRVNRRLQR